MASLIADYTYTSQLPFMLAKITNRPSHSTGPKHDKHTGMTIMQSRLWSLVWHMKDKVNVDPEFGKEHAAIRQFWLEKWVWRTYWPENQFPGVYPTRVNPVVVQRDRDGKAKVPAGPAMDVKACFDQSPASSQNSILGLGMAVSSQSLSRPETKLPFLVQPPTTGHLGTTSSLLTPYNYKSAPFNSQLQYNTIKNDVPERGVFDNNPRSTAYDAPEAYAIQRPNTTHQHTYPQVPTHSLHRPIINPTSHPLELFLTPTNIATILSNIMRYKPAHYLPIHGWDPSTSLPRYAVLNLAADGHSQFFGPKGGDGRFQRIREVFLLFRIMFQRLDHGAVIVWAEGRTRDMCRDMAAGRGLVWECFRRMWAFLRTWAEHGNTTGKSENIVEHLENCKDVWENLDTSALSPPPPPKQYHKFNPNSNPAITDTLGIAGTGTHEHSGAQNDYDMKFKRNQLSYAGQVGGDMSGGHQFGGSGYGDVQGLQSMIVGSEWIAPEAAMYNGGG